MKIIALLLILALASSLIGEEKLKPIAPYIDEILKLDASKVDFSQLGYVATRSAVLFTVCAAHLETYQGELKKSTEGLRAKLLERSLKLLQLANIINLRVDKMDAKNIDARNMAILEAYKKLIAESKSLNNTIFPEFISAELDKMNEVYPLLEQVHRGIFENSSPSH